MSKTDKKSTLKKAAFEQIALKKKNLLVMRIKRSSGDVDAAKTMKNTKKEIARLFTQINAQ